MSSSESLSALSLTAFAAELAANSPTPGGGSAAALTGALGAGLVSMAFRLAAREEGSAIPDYMLGRAEELDDLRECLLELVDRDAQAYQRLLRLAQAQGEQAARARLDALEAPLETAELALAALRLLAVGRAEVPARAASDADVARSLLLASAAGALATARANLGGVEDPERAEEYRLTIVSLQGESTRLEDLRA